jgi:hypothetical protein
MKIEKKWFGGKKTGCWIWIEYDLVNKVWIEKKKHFKEPIDLVRQNKLNQLLK